MHCLKEISRGFGGAIRRGFMICLTEYWKDSRKYLTAIKGKASNRLAAKIDVLQA